MGNQTAKNEPKQAKRESSYMPFQAEWKERYEAGESFTSIGKHFGVSYTTVQRVLKDVVTTRPKKQYAHLAQKWKRLYEEENWSIIDIGTKYNVNPATISVYLKKEGVAMRRATNRHSAFQKYEQEWVHLYEQGETLKSIGEQYGVHAQTVHNHISHLTTMRSYSETSRQYRVQEESFFDVIDTAEKTYWLGVWFGTGFISKRIAGFECMLIVDDEKAALLEAFRRRIGYEKPPEKEREGKMCLQFSDKRLFESLEKQGLGVFKTRNIRFPSDLSPSLYSSFFLGLFDTKGTFENGSTTDDCRLTFAAPHDFAVQLTDYLEKELSLCFSLVPRNLYVSDKRDNVYVAQLNNKKEAVRLLDWMYQSADTHYCHPPVDLQGKAL